MSYLVKDVEGFGSHRHGWKWVMSELKSHLMLKTKRNNGQNLLIDGFVEKTFVWGNKCSHEDAEWIGFIHNPPMMHIPRHCVNNQPLSNENLLNGDNIFMEKSRSKCTALVVTSQYHCQYLLSHKEWLKNSNETSIPVFVLYHPIPMPLDLGRFELNEFIKSKTKKILVVGWWLRKLSTAFECVALLGDESEWKVHLLTKSCDSEHIEHFISKEVDIAKQLLGSKFRMITELPFLNDSDYDRALQTSIVLLDVYDCSANNIVVECIARCTPIIVPRHPAIVEYLGENYPLYFLDAPHITKLLHDQQKITEAHVYLQTNNTIRSQIDISTFLKGMDDIIKKISNVE